MKETASIKKEQVRKTILAAGSFSDLPTKMELVDTLQRTGVAYHFATEIQALLRDIHGDDQGSSHDLHMTAVRFYLLRTHGYHVSPGIITILLIPTYM